MGGVGEVIQTPGVREKHCLRSCQRRTRRSGGLQARCWDAHTVRGAWHTRVIPSTLCSPGQALMLHIILPAPLQGGEDAHQPHFTGGETEAHVND